MNLNSLLNCLSVTGIATGTAILGVYSFSSGDTGIAFNQLYPSGSNYSNGFPYRAALPLIYNGSGNQPSGVLNGNQFYQISDIFSSSFSVLMSLNYSGCLNTGNINHLLVSTNPSPTSTTSGVYLGITPTNRLFLQTSGYSYTVPKEIGVSDFAFLSVVSNRFVSFGLFSVTDNKFHGKGYDATNTSLEVKDLCFGGALNYPASFTGYSGKLNEIYLFSGTVNTGSLGGCVDCSFATGYSYVPIAVPFTQTLITGSSWVGVATIGITGTQKALASYPKVGGGTGFVSFDSGMSGTLSSYQILTPMTQQITETGYYSGLSFLYSPRMSGALFDIQFYGGISSGDVVEVYTYPTFNSSVNLNPTGFSYPAGSEVLMFGNGLAETLNVDYGVAFNGLMTGFDSSDVLLYDVISPSVTMNYITGNVFTGLYNSQFAYITGATGVNFAAPFQYDIYFNGQKLISGYDYTIVPTGAGKVAIVSNTGSIYNLAFYDLNDPNGDYLELKFVPITSGVIDTVYPITKNQSVVSGVSGFSEQVWINGIRQKKGVDYNFVPRCRSCSGQWTDPNYGFVLYNSLIDTIGFFN